MSMAFPKREGARSQRSAPHEGGGVRRSSARTVGHRCRTHAGGTRDAGRWVEAAVEGLVSLCVRCLFGSNKARRLRVLSSEGL